ncbi:DUF2927 domain-containing protein [uncultured Tateyamaria sp.]|uniref:DUF2927 domain-containing protein n=1 Tax=uncultured Tateyamaria sp. TaxID=455651 RepID=UPI0026397E69|nr:DUF2927 domain-containing protein [uncultured Tateyamaria sp.]
MSAARAKIKAGMWGSLAALALLAACDPATQVDPVLTPQARPAAVALPVPAPAAPTSERSAALRRYLTQVQSSQLTSGLLRQDGGGPDTPFSAEMLARNFERIVFYNEYSATGATRGGASDLRRWSGPVRISVEFGPSVPPSQRMRDRADVRAYATRLARSTGHPVSTAGTPNFMVFFVSEDDRAATLNALAPRLPGVTERNLAALRDLPQDAYCAVAAYASGAEANTYTAAVAVIRAENPDLLRLSCIHEELAQGLGLANDSPDARPSIFNDDDEFALLTDHDEALLGMLYDARLTPGMTVETARPIVRILAREAVQGPL